MRSLRVSAPRSIGASNRRRTTRKNSSRSRFLHSDRPAAHAFAGDVAARPIVGPGRVAGRGPDRDSGGDPRPILPHRPRWCGRSWEGDHRRRSAAAGGAVLSYRRQPAARIGPAAPRRALAERAVGQTGRDRPTGIAPGRYEVVMSDAMSESQDVAAVVAERAAGYTVATPRTQVFVSDFTQASKANGILEPGDQIVSVAGRTVQTSGEIAKIIGDLPPGMRVPITLVRHGAVKEVEVPTIATKDGTRFGILVGARYAKPKLPIPVRYRLGNISGSSGGLMFALDIYRTLRPKARIVASKIAGTGTIAYDGSVGPIEGAAQKLIAAKRAGVRLFLCPKENYREIAGEQGVRIVPVGSFKEALRAIEAS